MVSQATVTVSQAFRNMRRFLPLLLIGLAIPAFAQSSSVPLPRERPPAAEESAVPLPRERPAATETSSSAAASSSEASSAESASASSSEPPAPPQSTAPPKAPRDYQVACPSLMNGQVTGKMLPPIHEGQCGIQSPLSIEAVSANGRSIPLNAPVITDCGMATAFPSWIAEVDSYLKAHDKTDIKTINLSTSYACRNVDNATAGNLSFHALADALDVMGFTLGDGRTIDIKSGYNGTPQQGSQILHFARDSACTHFMTVLGPEADSFHQDNMHIDLACHGKMCTARLCE
jgi:hypothetical protein